MWVERGLFIGPYIKIKWVIENSAWCSHPKLHHYFSRACYVDASGGDAFCFQWATPVKLLSCAEKQSFERNAHNLFTHFLRPPYQITCYSQRAYVMVKFEAVILSLMGKGWPLSSGLLIRITRLCREAAMQSEARASPVQLTASAHSAPPLRWKEEHWLQLAMV